MDNKIKHMHSFLSRMSCGLFLLSFFVMNFSYAADKFQCISNAGSLKVNSNLVFKSGPTPPDWD